LQVKERDTQILPGTVFSFDQRNLLLTLPALDCLLSADCAERGGMRIKPDQPIATIAGGKAVAISLTVFEYSAPQVGGHACV
jgi:hypothetical protein